MIRNIYGYIAAVTGIILMMSVTACRKDVDWSGTRTLPDNGWDENYSVEFNLDPAAYIPPAENRFAEMTARATGDTLRRIKGEYDATLSIRYLGDCNVRTLKVVVERISLDAPLVTDTIAIQLFSEKGEPYGKGRLGIYEAKARIPSPFLISEGTKISVRPIEYADTLHGFSDITLLIANRR